MLNLLADVDIGGITQPSGTVGAADPCGTIATLVQNGISLLLIVTFIIFIFWTIFAGLRFIFAAGDSKTVGQSWSSIYWGITGMVVVMSSFAIIKLVEIFFNVEIISGGLIIPGVC